MMPVHTTYIHCKKPHKIVHYIINVLSPPPSTPLLAHCCIIFSFPSEAKALLHSIMLAGLWNHSERTCFRLNLSSSSQFGSLHPSQYYIAFRKQPVIVAELEKEKMLNKVEPTNINDLFSTR